MRLYRAREGIRLVSKGEMCSSATMAGWFGSAIHREASTGDGSGFGVILTVTGAPRTKKNSRVHTRTGIPLPSKAWRAWVNNARILDACGHELVPCYPIIPDEALNCRAVFYRDARRGDAVGYFQGIADLLEKRRVVTDDAQIVSWNGSRMEIDRKNPRTEILLEAV